jgi:hypothetical protein
MPSVQETLIDERAPRYVSKRTDEADIDGSKTQSDPRFLGSESSA